MGKAISAVPRVALFLAGVAAGALSFSRRDRSGAAASETKDLRDQIARLENRVAEQEAAANERMAKVEAKLEEHGQKLAEVPSTAQIVSAMEQLLTKTMSSLDERLTSQAHSIEVLKMTVSQTDGLLERVLESLDSLQNAASDAPALGDDALLHRAT